MIKGYAEHAILEPERNVQKNPQPSNQHCMAGTTMLTYPTLLPACIISPVLKKLIQFNSEFAVSSGIPITQTTDTCYMSSDGYQGQGREVEARPCSQEGNSVTTDALVMCIVQVHW